MHTIVHDWEYGLLYEDGRFVRELAPGRYRLRWPFGSGRREIHTFARAPQMLFTALTDAISADRLLFRVGVTCLYEVKQPRLVLEQNGVNQFQLAVYERIVRIAGGRTLEALLAEREEAGRELAAALPDPIGGVGLSSISLSQIVLPPELRRLYAEFERARLEGLAALERARGEQAALRALNNAARLLKGNPELMNLRLLQAMAGSGGRSQPTLVLGAAAGVQPVSPIPLDEPV